MLGLLPHAFENLDAKRNVTYWFNGLTVGSNTHPMLWLTGSTEVG